MTRPDKHAARRQMTAAHVQCPECDEVIEIDIPVLTDIQAREDGQHFLAWVDEDGVDVQPVWDHALAAHGPRLDDGDEG